MLLVVMVLVVALELTNVDIICVFNLSFSEKRMRYKPADRKDKHIATGVTSQAITSFDYYNSHH